MADKIYINGIYIKEVPTKYGGIFNITIDIEKFGLSIKPHIKIFNDRKQVKISMMKRKEPGEHGDTHYCILNDYVKPEEKPEESKQTDTKDSGDDLPF